MAKDFFARERRERVFGVNCELKNERNRRHILYIVELPWRSVHFSFFILKEILSCADATVRTSLSWSPSTPRKTIPCYPAHRAHFRTRHF